ncbi:hypothetical protein C8R44DRAFT_980376 [Mycena epipterygia]|nr:hypothetical protein C8R44DRAFT_980376 [Mycena epipterygia]
MKRGFLNSSKARAKMAVADGPVTVSSKQNVRPAELRYGVLENVGVPEGYKLPNLELTDSGTNSLMVYTSLPNIPDGSPPAAYADGWSECLLSSETKAKIVSTPGFPSNILRPPKVRHRIGPVPGKGLGTFSTMVLHTGDLILSERALMIAPVAIGPSHDIPSHFSLEQVEQIQLAQREQILQASFDRMDTQYKKAYKELANSHLHDGSGPIFGVSRTNGLGVDPLTIEGDPPQFYSAVCKEISRLNHSCSPNTATMFDMASFSFRLYAVRDIAAKTLEPYGFRCTCRACRDPRTSDPRRATIRRMDAASPALMAMWVEEGLQRSNLYHQHAVVLMERYISLGDAENAVIYAAMLGKMKWIESEAQRWADPVAIKSHPMWRKGVR